MKPAISPEVRAVRDEAVRIRREIHQWPELGFEEARTGALAAKTLRRLGLKVKTGVAKTGVVGVLEGGRPGPTLLIRADMDALPLTEESGAPYASRRPGRMHACGHDAHVAISLGAAHILAAEREFLPGRIKFIYQPAEESPGGALPMIQAGVLTAPKVDAAIALHMWNDLPTGTLGVRTGALLACTDRFEIGIIGRGGHGAAPHQSVDPIVTASEVVSALQTIPSRVVSPLEPVVVSVCQIHGGTAFNVIPGRVTLAGTVRTFNRDLRRRLPKMMEEVVRGVTSAHRARYEFRFDPHYPSTVNDAAMTALVRGQAERVVGERNISEDVRTMGGEDMSYFLERVPGCFFFVGSAHPKKGAPGPHHSARFDIDEDSIPVGIEMLVRCARAYLDTPP